MGKGETSKALTSAFQSILWVLWSEKRIIILGENQTNKLDTVAFFLNKWMDSIVIHIENIFLKADAM